jgi:hypothetical protein
MWPIDYLGVPEWIERQSPRKRVLLAFLFFTVSFFICIRGVAKGFSLAHSLFDSAFGGGVFAGVIAWRDRRRARKGVGYPD